MGADQPRVLIVEDEAPIRAFLRPTLSAAGYALDECDSGARALTLAAARPPDLMLLDLGLPDIEGREVILRIREWSRLPILVLSARLQEAEKVAALDAGADDYLTKPFGTEELLARLRAALRRAAVTGEGPEPAVSAGEIQVDLAARRVLLAGALVHLTPIEYRLLAELARHPGRVLTHRHLLQAVWGPGHVERQHYLRVHMASLRRKLEPEPARPRHLITEQGVGYRLLAD